MRVDSQSVTGNALAFGPLAHQGVSLAKVAGDTCVSRIQLERSVQLRYTLLPLAKPPVDIAGIFQRQGIIRLQLQSLSKFGKSLFVLAIAEIVIQPERDVSIGGIRRESNRTLGHVFDLRQLSVSKILHKPMPIKLANDEMSHGDSEAWIAGDRLLVPTGRLIKSFWSKRAIRKAILKLPFEKQVVSGCVLCWRCCNRIGFCRR